MDGPCFLFIDNVVATRQIHVICDGNLFCLVLDAQCKHYMGLLPDTYNCGLRMRRECRERFPPPSITKETAS